jgi:hypothetical protein
MTNQARREIEQHIEALGWNVDIAKPDLAWLDDGELSDFIGAWAVLARYYAETDDSQMSMDAISTYVDFTRLLRRIALNPDVDESQRQLALDRLESLEAAMDDIIREGVTNLYDSSED